MRFDATVVWACFAVSVSSCTPTPDSSLEKGHQLLREAKACSADDQCVVTTQLFCPYGCYEAVNRNHDLAELNDIVRSLRRDLVCEACVQLEPIPICSHSLCETQPAPSAEGEPGVPSRKP